MVKLKPDVVAEYRRSGYLLPTSNAPLRALSSEQAALARQQLETVESATGKPANSVLVNGHISHQWIHDIVTSPTILDAVEDLIGPDILVWAAQFWVKEPGSGSYVGWHQDGNYWGLEPYDLVTAWVAISDVTPQSGPMQFIAGSHLGDFLPHKETYSAENLLSRGQEIAFDKPLDPSRVVTAALKPGEFTLFNIRLAHGSPPNVSTDRRIGLAIRYMPTTTRSIRDIGDTAMCVRGVDRFHHFSPDLPPSCHLSADAAEAARLRSTKHNAAVSLDGADLDKFRQVSRQRERRNRPAHLTKTAKL